MTRANLEQVLGEPLRRTQLDDGFAETTARVEMFSEPGCVDDMATGHVPRGGGEDLSHLNPMSSRRGQETAGRWVDKFTAEELSREMRRRAQGRRDDRYAGRRRAAR